MKSHPVFNRANIRFKPLASRQSKKEIHANFLLDSSLPVISEKMEESIEQLVDSLKKAKKRKAPIILVYGAHLFRNGLSPLVLKMMESGYIQHLVTNGAGSIHDWEMSFHGKTEEDVCSYIREGQFGIWEETGYFMNLAIILGNAKGLGYGASIGKMIKDDMLEFPSKEELRRKLEKGLSNAEIPDSLSAEAILLRAMEVSNLSQGKVEIPHPYKQISIQFGAYNLNIPFSVCPGIGYDIIYSHPINDGSAIGQCALTDFLMLVQTISQLEDGVLLVSGSSVMAPMIIEKAISMARNVAIQKNRALDNFQIFVNDIQPGQWDWKQGEPPKTDPAYYLRFCKSFSRVGGNFQYLELDNRAFLRHIAHRLSIADDCAKIQ